MSNFQDDLRFASESIQAIASNAIESIERLYSLRLSGAQPMGSRWGQDGVKFENFDRFDNSTLVETPKPDKQANQNTPKVQLSYDRPTLVDNDLHNLSL